MDPAGGTEGGREGCGVGGGESQNPTTVSLENRAIESPRLFVHSPNTEAR